MIWKRGNKSMVGVDIGSSSVKAVELRSKGGDFQLLSLGYEGLQPDSVVDGQIMELNAVSTAIGNIFNEHKIKTTFLLISRTSISTITLLAARLTQSTSYWPLASETKLRI